MVIIRTANELKNQKKNPALTEEQPLYAIAQMIQQTLLNEIWRGQVCSANGRASYRNNYSI